MLGAAALLAFRLNYEDQPESKENQSEEKLASKDFFLKGLEGWLSDGGSYEASRDKVGEALSRFRKQGAQNCPFREGLSRYLVRDTNVLICCVSDPHFCRALQALMDCFGHLTNAQSKNTTLTFEFGRGWQEPKEASLSWLVRHSGCLEDVRPPVWMSMQTQVSSPELFSLEVSSSRA